MRVFTKQVVVVELSVDEALTVREGLVDVVGASEDVAKLFGYMDVVLADVPEGDDARDW